MSNSQIPLPPGLAETEISIFTSARGIHPKPYRAGAVLASIRDGGWANPIAKLRALLDSGDKGVYDQKKKSLPAVTLSGSFQKRNAEALLRHSGLLQVDLDHLENPAEVRDRLAADPHIAAAFLSPSAQGVKAIMRIPSDPERHKQSFAAAERYLREAHGYENDRACSDVCRLCFVSHDPELRTNPNAVLLDTAAWTEPEPPASFDSHSEEGGTRSPDEEAARVRDALTHLSSEARDTWIRFCAALKNSGLPGAFEIWHEWSAKAGTYTGHEDCRRAWGALTPNSGINLDAIYKAACAAGWDAGSRKQVLEADTTLAERQRAELQEPDEEAESLCVVRADEVPMKPVRWLWPGILPSGKLVVLAGDPGLGKSQVTIFVAATVSTGGGWPVTNEGCEPGSVVILSAEDGAEDTIVPRLKAAGADLGRVHIVQAVRLRNGRERHLDLTSDTKRLAGETERLGDVRLIVVDPISSYLGSVDSHRNSEVRVALNPVVELAEEVGACLLCVTHLNKSSTNALNRVTGSIAFVATARASYLATKDSQNPERILMLPLKNNLAKDTSGFAFTVEETEIGDDITSTKVVWESEPVTITADEALSPTGEVGNRLTDAEEFLKEELREVRVPSEELFARGEAQGISKKSLYGAKKKLGILARKVGFQGAWHWELPEGDTLESAKLPDAKIPPETPKIPKQEKGASLESLESLEYEPPNQKEFTGVI